jgi:hypothetical protein
MEITMATTTIRRPGELRAGFNEQADVRFAKILATGETFRGAVCGDTLRIALQEMRVRQINTNKGVQR